MCMHYTSIYCADKLQTIAANKVQDFNRLSNGLKVSRDTGLPYKRNEKQIRAAEQR